MTAVLVAKSLAVGYERLVVTHAPDLSLAAGERIVIAGPNGSGKTTVLKTFAGLIRPVSGTLTAPRPGAGGAIYVHSAPFLFTGSGRHNVLLGAGGNTASADEALRALEAQSFSDADVRTLSTGQRQRIALARALAARPSLLLVDEPETGLDTAGLAAWTRVLETHAHIAIVIATHRDVPGATRYTLSAIPEQPATHRPPASFLRPRA